KQGAFDALIVDFGGVLTDPLQVGLEAFAQSLDIELQDLVRVILPIYSGASDRLVEGFETGMVGEAEFSQELARRLEEACGRPVRAAGLVGRIFGGVQLQAQMLQGVLAARRNGMKTALLSNSWGVQGYPRDRFEDLFDVVVISAEVGMRKPDPAIFRLVVERLGVPAAKCVFVDDYPGHLQPAQAAGMTTILHISPEETLRQLTRLGVPLTKP
ncbi:MAG: HAD family phosphatase, partial [Actinomycetota bacterium]|nr:HAD family phosphatase [Actinomycetota bacterium]